MLSTIQFLLLINDACLISASPAHHRRVELTTYDGYPNPADGIMDCAKLKADLVAHGSNSYSFLLWDDNGEDYLSTVRCLDALQGFSVGRLPFSAWITLIPPSESASKCSVPADSPLTPFNETAFFDQSKGNHGCFDYSAWSKVIGKLATLYPSLRYLNVDDLTHNPSTFTKAYVQEMADLLRPNVRLIPTVYYGAHQAAGALPIDGMLFYFRNQKAGGCPAECGLHCSHEWPGSACLAGSCAELTVKNLPGEVADVRAALRQDLPLHVGIYVEGRDTACANPSAKYGQMALETALSLPSVSGATAYWLQASATPKRAAIASAFSNWTSVNMPALFFA